MRNSETGKYEVKRVFKKEGFTVVGTGDTKEAAKEDLQKNLEQYRIPGTSWDGYQGPKYAAKKKVVGYVKSPGFVMKRSEDGVVEYVYDENRQAQVYALETPSQNLANSDKVETEEN
jgi:hypothetical protein